MCTLNSVYAPYVLLQDVRSRSWLVRTYYRNRIFMGFCCICCEVMYLALYLLAWPQYQRFGVIPIQIPPAVSAAAAKVAPSLPWGQQLIRGLEQWQGLPFAGLVALLAVPGVLVKQACNWVQLRTAVQGLVNHDVKHMQ
jgi:CDP-diacylglycerol--inositol 3-phosphatidyltransferase